MNIEIGISPSLRDSDITISLIWADGITASSYSEGKSPVFFEKALSELRNDGFGTWDQAIRERVRKMLRYGKYKPSGRSKPASEFLLNAAQENRLAPISPPVDVNNIVSLSTGLPGSIFDADKTGDRLLLRRGEKGESYVFNGSGQSIDLEDLLLVCRKDDQGEWRPCGNPVKDSMETKISDLTRKVVGILYIPKALSEENIVSGSILYSSLLKEHCGAYDSGYRVISC
ncbi:MAG: hypothetical protein HQK54_00655 [Oligoflexales bacterium]|nr:hypothetical protein [Oligoflexales bacterium]